MKEAEFVLAVMASLREGTAEAAALESAWTDLLNEAGGLEQALAELLATAHATGAF